MDIFISWSGNLSKTVAESLRTYLPCMLQDLDVFVSGHDLESGTRWMSGLSERLSNSLFGILCLTAENQLSPWLVYEAGALTKVAEGRACGLLLAGLTPANVSGPLAQFQHRKMNEQDFALLLRDINAKLETPLPDDALGRVFKKWWPDIDAAYTAALKASPEVSSPSGKRSDRELLEEVLERVRVSPQGGSVLATEANDTLNAAQALLRIIRARSEDEIAFLHRINLLKNLRDHDAVESYAEMHAAVATKLQSAGLLWRTPQGRLVMNRFVGECVLPMMLETPTAPKDAPAT